MCQTQNYNSARIRSHYILACILQQIIKLKVVSFYIIIFAEHEFTIFRALANGAESFSWTEVLV
jgi:hypothetical protein